MTPARTSVVFIHGLWLHASSWHRWADMFRLAGYDTHTPGWPGEPETVSMARAHPELVAGRSLAEVTAHFAELMARLPSPPVVIGHSFGGLIAQKLLGEGRCRAAIAIDPAQIRGVFRLPLAQLRAGLPGLGNPMNVHKAVALTQAQFRYGFGNALERAESDALFERWCIPSPVRGLFEVAFANVTGNPASQVATDNDTRGPLLLISGTHDHTAPDVTTLAAFRMYRHSKALTELRQFEGRGHSLTIDHGWRDVARACLRWLERQALVHATTEQRFSEKQMAADMESQFAVRALASRLPRAAVCPRPSNP